MQTDYPLTDQESKQGQSATTKLPKELQGIDDLKELDQTIVHATEKPLFGLMGSAEDFSKISEQDLSHTKIVEKDCFVVTKAPASGDSALGLIFIAIFPCEVVAFSEVHSAKASGTCTIQLRKASSGVAENAGTNLLTSNLSLENANETPQTLQQASLVTGALRLSAGDRLYISLIGGATTGLQLSMSQVYLQYTGQGDYRTQ